MLDTPSNPSPPVGNLEQDAAHEARRFYRALVRGRFAVDPEGSLRSFIAEKGAAYWPS